MKPVRKKPFKQLRDEARCSHTHAKPCHHLRGAYLRLLRVAYICSRRLQRCASDRPSPFLGWHCLRGVPFTAHARRGKGLLSRENTVLKLPKQVRLCKASLALHKLWRQTIRPITGEVHRKAQSSILGRRERRIATTLLASLRRPWGGRDTGRSLAATRQQIKLWIIIGWRSKTRLVDVMPRTPRVQLLNTWTSGQWRSG